MTIGPDAWAYRSLVMVRLAVLASAPPASAVSRKLRREIRCVMVFSCIEQQTRLARDPEIAVHDLGLRFEVVGGTIVYDRALFHQKYARTQLERGLDILLHQQDRDAALVDAVNLAPDLRHQARHDAFRRLVENDELRPHHQAAGDG